MGFDSVYVLVDKIDETDVTGGDSKKAARLVTPLLTNIKLLELDTVAFKFFYGIIFVLILVRSLGLIE